MKKIFYLLTVFFLTTNFVVAQEFSIGIRDGISWSWINGSFNSGNPDIKCRIGHVPGFMINMRAAAFLTLQMEINYEEKGFSYTNIMDGGGFRGSYDFNYISIPFLANFEIGNKIRYFGYAGLSAGFLVKAKNYSSASSTSSPDPVIYDRSYDPTEYVNKYEFGGLVGLGIRIPLCEKVKMNIDSRFNFGLTRAAQNREGDTFPPDDFQDVYNRSVVVSLGILYRVH
jgi:hypothetical protein